MKIILTYHSLHNIKIVWKKIDNMEKEYSIEELALGIVYREFRVAKGFSQKEAANGEITHAHLSNFESGKTIVASNHLMRLLCNINVTWFEFQNAYNRYLESQDILLFDTDVTNAVMERDLSKLKRILKRLEERLSSQNLSVLQKKLKIDIIRVKATMSLINPSYTIGQDEIEFVVDYLYKLKEWGQYEIWLLGQCAPFLDWYKLMDLTNSMICPSQTNSQLHYIKLAITQNLLNIINVFIDQNNLTLAKKYLTYLEESNIHEYFMYEKLTLIYTKAVYSYKSKKDEASIDIMKRCQDIFEYCDCLKTSNWVTQEISSLLENDPNKLSQNFFN